jgi:hypothetical protein
LYNPNTGEHFYTSSSVEKSGLIKVGWSDEGIGWVAPKTGKPVYRLYNPNAKGGDHYYTLVLNEKNTLVKLGWHYDGVFFNSGGSVPVYVAYNPNAKSGAHNYTVNGNEQKNLLSLGWKYGATAWYAQSTLPVPVITPHHVDVGITGIGGSEQVVPGSYRLLYSNKPFDEATLTGPAAVDFSADVTLTGSSKDYQTQFVIAGHDDTNTGGQIGVELHYQAGVDLDFAQDRINVTTIDFPAGAGVTGQQFYSVDTGAATISNGQVVHLEVKYFSSGYMQAFVDDVLVGQYATQLVPDGDGRYMLHDNTDATTVINNLKVLKDGVDVTNAGAPSFAGMPLTVKNSFVQGLY